MKNKYEKFKSIISKISLLIRNLKMDRHALFKVLGELATASATRATTTSVEGKSSSPEVELLLFFLVMIGFFAAMLYLARQEMGRPMFSR